MFHNNKVMQVFLQLLLLILDHLKSKHKLCKTPQWYEMFQHHQGHVKCCKVPSRSYFHHVEPSQPLSLKHSGSDVSKVSEGSGLKALRGTLGLGQREE